MIINPIYEDKTNLPEEKQNNLYVEMQSEHRVYKEVGEQSTSVEDEYSV